MRQIWKIEDNKKMKNCRSCKQWFPATEKFFFKHTGTADKLRSECRKCQGVVNLDYRLKIKREILSHYGEKCTNPSCVMDDIVLLTIDHIHNNGAEHRKTIKNAGGHAFYLWLKRNNFPEGYQTLCWNCNCYKGVTGKLPVYKTIK